MNQGTTMQFTQQIIAAPDGYSQQVQEAASTLANSMLSLMEAATPVPAGLILGILDSLRFIVMQDILDQVNAPPTPAPAPTPAPSPTPVSGPVGTTNTN